MTSSDLIQIGTDNTVSAGGTVSAEAFYELLPASSHTIASVPVSPGDSISATISEISSGQWSVSLTDNTTSKTFSTTLTYTSSHSSAEWIEEDPSYTNGSLVPFDNFGTVSFSGGLTTASGISKSVADAGSSSITLVDSKGSTIATPSAVSGGSFSITHK